jgi:hypothetical protein
MDWELSYFVTSEIYQFFMTLWAAFAYFYLVRDFVRSKKTAVLTGGAYLAVMLILWYEPYYILSFWAYLIGAAAGLGVMCLLERENYLQKVFLAWTFYAVRWLVARLTVTVGALLWKVFLFVIPGYIDVEKGYYLYVTQSLIEIPTQIVLYILALAPIVRAYRGKGQKMQGREFLLMSLPSFTSVMGYAYVKYIWESPVGLQYSEVDSSLLYHGIVMVYCLSLYIPILVVVALYQNIKESQQEKMRKDLLAGQMEDMKRHIREVEELYQEIRSLKHDMGNHVMVMQKLAGHEQEQYVQSLRAQYSVVADRIQSGNPVTDVILMERSREAQAKGIAFDCSFLYPAGREVDAFDLSIILNNALANAIEAVQRKASAEDEALNGEGDRTPGYIRISSSLRENVYMIEVENSCYQKIVMDREEHLPVTTKEDKDFHGFGLRNIRRVAQKYHGDIEVEADQQVFRLSVMLQVCRV